MRHRKVVGRKLPILTYLTCIWHLHLEWLYSDLIKLFFFRKLESLGCCMALFAWFCVLSFWYNNGLWETDGRYTQAIAYAALEKCRAGKIILIIAQLSMTSVKLNENFLNEHFEHFFVSSHSSIQHHFVLVIRAHPLDAHKRLHAVVVFRSVPCSPLFAYLTSFLT